jgi:nickel-dependent lactate racemase
LPQEELMTAISLEYGTTGCWEGEIAGDRLLLHHAGPAPLRDVRAAIRESLESPIEFPALHQAVVPGDRIVLVLDRNVPSAAEIVAEVCAVLLTAGVEPDHVQILQPASLTGSRPSDPRQLLPAEICEVVGWKIHDPTARDAIGYLASSAGGERLYLAREVLEADLVIPIARLGYDSVQGRRHVMGSFYPGLSNTEAFTKSHGEGHSELGPDDERPLRQLVQELVWLAGIQFAIQVLPAGRRGGAARILAGQPDAVTQHGQTVLDDNWRVCVEQRGEAAIVSIPTLAGEPIGWDQLGAALEAASKLVVTEGRIVVLSDLAAEPTPGIEMLRSYRSASQALKPLRHESPPDLVAASQIARAADWASVYLLSQLPSTLVEDLFMTPLEHEREATRLIAQCDGCVVFDGAQHTFTEIADE